MRILHVTNEGRGSLAGLNTQWLGAEFTVACFTLEDLVRFRRSPDRDPVVQREALDRAVAETEGFDWVYAEAPEAVLLHYARTRHGLRPLRWIVNVVNLLERVTPLRELIGRAYGDDPLVLAAADTGFRWYVTTRAHLEPLVAAGLPPERGAFIAANTVQAPILPGASQALAEASTRPLPNSLRDVAGGILLAGVNNRDVATLARAAELARVRVHILTDLDRVAPVASPWLNYHGLVPLPDFLAAVAAARVLVLALRAGEGSCGQQTLAFAQHLRTLLVASDVPAVRDYLIDGVSGILVPPEDPVALASALRRAPTEPGRAALVEAAFQRNARDNERVEQFFRDAFLAPAAGADPARQAGLLVPGSSP